MTFLRLYALRSSGQGVFRAAADGAMFRWNTVLPEPTAIDITVGRRVVSGKPVTFMLTPGNIAAVRMAIPLPETIRGTRRLLVDNADSLRGWLTGHKIKVVIAWI